MVTKVPIGGSAPTTSTWSAARPISSSASRSAVSQQRLASVSRRPPGERDLAGVAAEVVAALGEHEARVVRVAEERHQDRGLGGAVGVEPLGLLGAEQGRAQRAPLTQAASTAAGLASS